MSIFLNVEQWSHSGQYATHLGILSASVPLGHKGPDLQCRASDTSI